MRDDEFYSGWNLVMNSLQDAYDKKVAKMDPDYPFAQGVTEMVEDMIDDNVFDFEVKVPLSVPTGFQIGMDCARTEIQRIALDYRRERGITNFKIVKIEF